jgi:hypothetical protein
MPASETHEGRRGGPLPTALLWCGVGLAPVAALLLLLGQTTAFLRLAAALVIGAVVLIGLSMALRPNPERVRADIEDLLYDEIDSLHADARADIATAARATHRAFGEKLLALQNLVESLRAEVEALRVQVEQATVAAGPPHGVRARAAPRVPAGHSGVGGHPGVVRHTETVVTTRQTTLVDSDESGRGTVYGSRSARVPDPAEPARRGDRPAPAARREPGPSEESWTDQLLRERFGDRFGVRLTDRVSGGADGERRHAAPELPAERESEDELITGLRTSDRWASVRSDDRGKELRMGERRAAVRADESGTELRIEDRWAAVLREDARRQEMRRADTHLAETHRADAHRPETHRDGATGDESWRPASRRDRDADRDDERDWRDGERDRARVRGRTRDDERDDLGDWRRGGDWDRVGDRDVDWRRDHTVGRDDPDNDGIGGYWSERSWEEERADEPGRWTEVRRERRGSPRSPAALPAAPAEPDRPHWTESWRSELSAEPSTRRSRHAAEPDDEYRPRASRDEDGHRSRAGRERIADFDLSDERWR